MKSIQVPLKKIRRDHDGHKSQIREQMDQDTVASYAVEIKRGAEFPPIELIEDDKGKYFIVDGWHRTHAHVEAKKTQINAVIHPPLEGNTPLESAIRMALESNLKHGLRLAPEDERNKAKVALLLPQMKSSSNRGIAKLIKVSHQTVGRARNDLAREGLLPNPVTGEMVCDSTPLEFTSIQAVKDTYFDLGQAEINACNELLRKTREFIMQKDWL